MADTNFTSSEKRQIGTDMEMIMAPVTDMGPLLKSEQNFMAASAHVPVDKLDPYNKGQIDATVTSWMAPDAKTLKAAEEMKQAGEAYLQGAPARDARMNAAYADLETILKKHGYDPKAEENAHQLNPGLLDNQAAAAAKAPASAPDASPAASAVPTH